MFVLLIVAISAREIYAATVGRPFQAYEIHHAAASDRYSYLWETFSNGDEPMKVRYIQAIRTQRYRNQLGFKPKPMLYAPLWFQTSETALLGRKKSYSHYQIRNMDGQKKETIGAKGKARAAVKVALVPWKLQLFRIGAPCPGAGC